MPGERYDLVVLGCGPAGEKGAAQAAYFGKKVAVVERRPEPGGAGINTGTLPSKTLRETALYFSGLRQRGLYGIDYSLKEGLTIGAFMHRKEAVIEREHQLIRRNLLRHNIELVRGDASLADAHTVRVVAPDGSERRLETDVVLVATGSSPHRPDDMPFDGRRVVDSDSILTLDRIPRSLLVVGGGVIGSEYASLFSAFGTRVTLIDTRDRLLPFVDGEIAQRLRDYLEAIGLLFRFGTKVASVGCTADGARVVLDGGEALEADVALIAAGRQSNVEGLGLEAVGVAMGKRGLIQVNQQYQTSVANIYAAGDVIGFPALASTSMEQARVAMVHAFGLKYKEKMSPVLPLAVYAVPEIAQVGPTEEECREKDVEYLAGRAYFERNPRGLIIGESTGMLKLLFAPSDRSLLAVHLIGELASELVHIGAQVMAQGGTIDAFVDAVYNYPTLSDSYKYAAYDGLGALKVWKSERGLA